MSISIARGDEFDTGLLGHRCWLELATGEQVQLDVDRWGRDPGDGDEAMLERCTGPTLDIGCGPGRLAAALSARGVLTLGIDTSPVAIGLTQRRGGVALHRSVFDPLPAEGSWRHVLLADGNIGIGGDPVALLRRSSELIADGGSVLVEVEAPGSGVRRERVRVSAPDNRGDWFPWAWLGMDGVADVARQAGLRVAWTGARGDRWFAELEPGYPARR